MTKALSEAAFEIDKSLRPAEAATNDAAIASATLLLTLLAQHSTSNLPDALGLSAIGHASRAAALSVEAREAHIRAHGALNLDLKKLGMSEMFGKPTNPPSDGASMPRFFVSATTEPVTP